MTSLAPNILIDENAHMNKELLKFINLYNRVAGVNFNLDTVNYSKLIRIIGNYILTQFNKNTWSNSVINFEDSTIDLSVFKSTKYYIPVENFLLSLESSFYLNLDEEIKEYFNSSQTLFNQEEQSLCLEFYNRLSKLEQCMKIHTFTNPNLSVGTVEHISGYHEALQNYHDIVLNVSIEPEKMAIIEKFNIILKDLNLKKQKFLILLDI
jgi:hypothetical protein